MENEAVLLKIKKIYSKDESIAVLLKTIKELRIEVGTLKSELDELRNNSFIERNQFNKEVRHLKKGLSTIQSKNVLLKRRFPNQ